MADRLVAVDSEEIGLGDLITFGGSDSVVLLKRGSNGQFLVADSTQPSGMRWTTVASEVIEDATIAAIIEDDGSLTYTALADLIADLAGGGGGVTDHGALTGLEDDDHPQYLTEERGDARYYTQGALDSLLADKAEAEHTHVAEDISDSTEVGRDVLTAEDAAEARAALGAAEAGHTHDIADVTGLQDALDGKQAAGNYADVATSPYIIKWDSATEQWPARPAAEVVPVGLAWFDSSDDPEAPAPAGALSDGSVTDKWLRKVSEEE